MRTIAQTGSIALLAAAAYAQPVTYTVLVDETTPGMRATGDRPALEDDTIAFYGVDRSINQVAIFSGPVGGPYATVVRVHDPVPNKPGRVFLSLQNPDVWDGKAYFDGGWRTSPPDGIYEGDGGPLRVVLDTDVARAWPTLVSAGEGGFISGSLFCDYNGNTFPYIISLEPAPGGGFFSTTSPQGDRYAYGGGRAVVARYVSYENGHDVGLYTWSPADPVLRPIVNWNNTIPSDGRTFTYMSQVDTDGERVSFLGAHGNPSFGGIEGVFTASVFANNAGPITTIALQGQPSPDGRPFHRFDHSAIEGESTYFTAGIGDTTQSTLGLFVSRGGVTTPLLLAGQTIDGKVVTGMRLTHKGVSNGRVLLRASYDYPSAPWGVGYMLILIDTGIAGLCAADWDGSRGVDGDDITAFFADWQLGDADIDGSGGSDGDDVVVFFDHWQSGC